MQSYFLRHGDGRVTCPLGRELFPVREKKYGIAYRGKEACRTCPNRCTGSANPKEARFGKDTNCVPVFMYGTSETKLQRLPEAARRIMPKLQENDGNTCIFTPFLA